MPPKTKKKVTANFLLTQKQLEAIKEVHKTGKGSVAEFVRVCKNIETHVHYGCIPSFEVFDAFYAGTGSPIISKKQNSEAFIRCGTLSRAIEKSDMTNMSFSVHLIFYPEFSENSLIEHVARTGCFKVNKDPGQTLRSNFLYVISFRRFEHNATKPVNALGLLQPNQIFPPIHLMHEESVEHSKTNWETSFYIEGTATNFEDFDATLFGRNDDILKQLVKEVREAADDAAIEAHILKIMKMKL